ncbi:hypothetical protein KCU83_g425, partial [Aureobasidium melanogenum]
MNTQPDLLIQPSRNSDLTSIESRGHDSLLCFCPQLYLPLNNGFIEAAGASASLIWGKTTTTTQNSTQPTLHKMSYQQSHVVVVSPNLAITVTQIPLRSTQSLLRKSRFFLIQTPLIRRCSHQTSRSAICATLIVTFLAIHNNTPIESWTFYFSINTVVSTLGVVFKSTLFIAVSAALAQGKWTWFCKRNGPLSTFEAIDAANRDTLESFKLLWSMRGQHLVSAGALVIALGFMVDPFLQAIISDYGRLVNLNVSAPNSTRATIGKSNHFDGGTQCVSTWSHRYPQIDTTPDFAVAAALYDGLNAALSHSYQNVSFTCTSGNCTWTEYTSLAVRSTCFDISSFLKRTTPEDAANATSTTQTSSSVGSNPVTDSTDVTSMSQPIASYGEEFSHAYSGTSTSDPAPTQSMVETTAIASPNTSPSEILEEPTYTALSAFSDVSTVNSEVASVQSTATEATVGLHKRESSSVQSSSTPTQSSSTWTDWTLEHLGLTLSNTNQAWRNASNFAVLQAAVVADPNLTINFVTSQALLAAFTVIRTDNNFTLGSAAWDAADASAMECGLELALNVYNSSVNNNVLMEQVVASASKVPGSWLPLPPINQTRVDPDNLSVDPGTLESNPIYHHRFLYRYDYALDPTVLQTSVNETFTVSQNTLVSTLDFLTSLIRQDNDNATVKAVIQEDQTLLYTYGSAILQPLFNQTNTTAIFDAVARSMSNAIRNVGKDEMLGTTQQWVRYYQVRWAFLTLPLSLITTKQWLNSNLSPMGLLLLLRKALLPVSLGPRHQREMRKSMR